MNRAYWFLAPIVSLFLGWAHCHTDEVPIVFGMVLLGGLFLGTLSPRRFLVSWAAVGAPIPLVELLLHFSLIPAPYPPTPLSNIPLIALAASVPALIGISAGAGLRRLTRKPAVR